MESSKNRFVKRLLRRDPQMLAASLPWDPVTSRQIFDVAQQVIVFGSWAVGANTSDSDLDILCVGEGKTHLSKELDVVWLPESVIFAKSFLGSELANHVAVFGVWLKGSDEWRHRVFVSHNAIMRKCDAIVRHVASYVRIQQCFSPSYVIKHRTLLRRNLQRLSMLANGEAVPPSKFLDELAADESSIASAIRRLPASSVHDFKIAFPELR